MIDGQAERAYVALATESAVAVVDIVERRVVDRWTAVPDPMAMALSADGELCMSLPSAQVMVRHPFVEEHSFEAERDLIHCERPTAVLIPHFWTLVAPSMACSLDWMAASFSSATATRVLRSIPRIQHFFTV